MAVRAATTVTTLAAGIGVAALLYQEYRLHQSRVAGQRDHNLKEDVKAYMKKHMENLMIQYKRINPNATFEQFIADNFPENSYVDQDGNLMCDDRVRGDSWEGTYRRVKANDPLHQIGAAPPMGASSRR